MTDVWGIHAGEPRSAFLDSGVVVLERGGIRESRELGGDQEVIESELTASYPDATARTVAAWARLL